MRPVRLDVDGFASFRESASVDFTDADYFSFVGNTGSGKSTLIDAICFALYGTAPRWGRANAVGDALAPTKNRATVRLVFDLGDERYQAVREVRRSGGAGTVQTKGALLERFLDPRALPLPGEETATEVLAGEARRMTPAVVELLGMEFDDFCQCVVLPQGEFARFLKATRAERQTILLKLLGGDAYERMRRAANARAKQAQTQLDLLTDQHGRGSTSTPEQVEQLAADLTALDAAVAPVQAAVDELVALGQTEEAARVSGTRATDLAATLSYLAVPEGLTARHDALLDARDALATATEAVATAEGAADAAANAVAVHPTRPALEQIASAREERDGLVAQVADLTREETDLRSQEEAALVADTTARDRLEELRAGHQSAAQADRDAAAAVERASTLAARTSGLTVPDELDTAAGEPAARSAVGAAEQDVADAQRALDAVTAELETAPPSDELRRRLEAVDRFAQRWEAWHTAADRCRELDQQHADAVAENERHQQVYEAAEDELHRRRRDDRAAALRADLQVGDDCPVCTQQVSVLPAAGDTSAALVDAQTRAEQARTVEEESRRRADQLGRERDQEQQRHTWEREALIEDLAALVDTLGTGATDLPADPESLRTCTGRFRAALDAANAQGSRLRAEQSDHRQRLSGLEKVLKDAEEDLRRAQTAHTVAAQRLVSRSEQHAADGAPAPSGDPASLHADWTALVDWARDLHHRTVEEVLPAAHLQHTSTTAALEQVVNDGTAAAAAAEATGAELTRLRTELARTSATLSARRERVGQLDEILTDAPSADELSEQLTRADELARVAAEARAHRDSQREAHRTAAERHDEAVQATRADREAFDTARDRVSGAQPPGFPASELDEDLHGCWVRLVSWATERVVELHTERDASLAAAAEAGQRRDARVTELGALLDGHGIEYEHQALGQDPRTSVEGLAVARAETRDRLAGARKDLERQADLVRRITEATERQRVAAELASLLRADKFQQWLAGAALDTLVTGASSSLDELSGGQFSLTHDKGEFYVVDHFDADSTRSVKTLSGGETFQTSLALALALSEQLAALAAGGVVRLESIFLDEGFGTLDPDSLDTVAATLENLAQGRMVGVVTHVQALADRTPVRFRVTRDHLTSRVEREAL